MKEKMIIFELKRTNSISLHKFTEMIALTGTYHNGRLALDEPIGTDKPMKVIVTFLEETNTLVLKKGNIRERFSFDKSRELLKDYKGSLSDAVIERTIRGLMNVFLDTSALFKLYHREEGSSVLEGLKTTLPH